jgi:hypothetical protein
MISASAEIVWNFSDGDYFFTVRSAQIIDAVHHFCGKMVGFYLL